MWFQSEDTTIYIPHSLQLTLVRFRYWEVAPSLVTRRLYASLPRCPQMKPGVQVIALLFPRFVYGPTLSNIRMSVISVLCNQMGFLLTMWP